MTHEQLFWDQLLDFIAEEHVIPIVGRDVLLMSTPEEKMYFQPYLAKRLAEYLGVSSEDLSEGNEFDIIARRFVEKGNRIEDIYSALKRIMPSDKELSLPSPLEKLAAITPFTLFVTTTFDPLLQHAIDHVRFKGEARTKVLAYSPTTVTDLAGPVRTLTNPLVYHLFGRVSAIPDYALTQEDILEFLHTLQSVDRQPSVLFDELNRSHLLILGCSFGDWLARFFLRTSKRKRLLEVRGTTDFVADAKITKDENLVLFLRQFSASTKIFEGGGALEFIDELHQRWQEHGTAPPPPPPPVETGRIFLSYAHEDSQAARKIKDTLESEGIDVIFDKDRLKAGDAFEKTLKHFIAQCSLFIPVISQHTLTPEKRFFRIEWNFALEDSLRVAPTQRFIIPVVIDNTLPDEPRIPTEFRDLHWEEVPDGVMNSRFVAMLKNEYRNYQKTVVTNQ